MGASISNSNKARDDVAGASGVTVRKRKSLSLPAPKASSETVHIVHRGAERALEVLDRPRDDSGVFGELVVTKLGRIEGRCASD